MKKHFSTIILVASGLVICLIVGGCTPDSTTSAQGAEPFEAASIATLDTTAREITFESEDAAFQDEGLEEGEPAVEDLAEEVKFVPKAVPKPKLKPRLKVPNSVFDYGFINEGDKISHTFTILNTGKANLLIDEILPACGCTIAKISQKRIKPGSSATLKVDFDSNDKFGKQNKVIEILSNAGYHEVRLVGVVYPKNFNKEEKKDTPGTVNKQTEQKNDGYL